MAHRGEILARWVKRAQALKLIVAAIGRGVERASRSGVGDAGIPQSAQRMNYTLYCCSSHERIDSVEMHVLAKAYRSAWRSLWTSDPAGPHLVNALDLVIDFGPSRAATAAQAPGLAGEGQRGGAAPLQARAWQPGDFSMGKLAVAAAEFARRAHRDQRGEDGVTPYFESNVVAVVDALIEIGASEQMIAAGYLCGVIARTSATLDQIEEAFGAYVAALVVGASSPWRHGAEIGRARRETLELERLALESAEVQTLRLAQDLANLRDPHWLRQAARSGWLAEVAARAERLVLANGPLQRRVRAALELWQAIPWALEPGPATD